MRTYISITYLVPHSLCRVHIHACTCYKTSTIPYLHIQGISIEEPLGYNVRQILGPAYGNTSVGVSKPWISCIKSLCR